MEPLPASAGDRPAVLVAGGGIAGAEALLALREHAGDRVDLRLVAPDPLLRYPPGELAEALGGPPAPQLELAELCREAGAELIAGAVRTVGCRGHAVGLADGRSVPYDALVLAVGARPEAVIPGAVTLTEPGGLDTLTGLPDLPAHRRPRTAALVVPTGVTWSLPMYELALWLGERARELDPPLALTLVTAEPRPLAIFDRPAAEQVTALLAEQGVELLPRTHVTGHAHGVLELAPGPPERLAAGLVAVLPHPTGRRLGGLPRDPRGFIPVDPHGGVLGVPDVYAAGDATTHPIRQGGLAAQQAEAVATTIAARAGAPVEPAAFRPVLRGTLVAGAARRWMHADIGAGLGTGRAACSSEPLWSEPGGHVVAPRLAALLRRCGQSRRGGAASPDAAG